MQSATVHAVNLPEEEYTSSANSNSCGSSEKKKINSSSSNSNTNSSSNDNSTQSPAQITATKSICAIAQPETIADTSNNNICSENRITSNSSENKLKLLQSDDEIGDKVDWYGNQPLHNHFAGRNGIQLEKIRQMSINNPSMNNAKNQFGRIPLHYAIDRLNVDTKAVKILLEAYPDGVCDEDFDGFTPYDLAIKWNHPNSVIRLLLSYAPYHDRLKYLQVTYGPLGSMFGWLLGVQGRCSKKGSNRRASSYEDVEDEADDDGDDADEVTSDHGNATTDAPADDNANSNTTTSD